MEGTGSQSETKPIWDVIFKISPDPILYLRGVLILSCIDRHGRRQTKIHLLYRLDRRPETD